MPSIHHRPSSEEAVNAWLVAQPKTFSSEGIRVLSSVGRSVLISQMTAKKSFRSKSSTMLVLLFKCVLPMSD